jgi:fructokinase
MLIGIDWGGSKIEGIALGEAGVELARIRHATPRGDYASCLRQIRDIVDGLESRTGHSGTVGVGIPGSIEPNSRKVKGASSTWLLGRRVEADLQEVLGREIRAENDADCFAVSEAVDGAGAGHRLVYGVILGSSCGAGLAIDGAAHSGPNTSAGEWGHNPLPHPTAAELAGGACFCGRVGCLANFVSGLGFEADYARHAVKPLKAPDIIALRDAGDHLAGLVWRRYIDRLARGLSLVVNSTDPDIFVFGGGMSQVPGLCEDLSPALANAIFSTVFHTPLVPSRHGDSGGVRGAAWLWKPQAWTNRSKTA